MDCWFSIHCGCRGGTRYHTHKYDSSRAGAHSQDGGDSGARSQNGDHNNTPVMSLLPVMSQFKSQLMLKCQVKSQLLTSQIKSLLMLKSQVKSWPLAPPWHPALPALSRSPATPLPRGPGPPSLPLFRLRSTALLDCIGASGSRSLGGGGLCHKSGL